MTGYKFGFLLTALLYFFAGASITTGKNDNSTTAVARQFILPPRIHQISPFAGTISATDPSVLAFHGIPETSSEIPSQQIENQIAHLNELTQQLRGMPQSPSITQVGKGLPIPLSRYAAQIEKGASENGVSRPLGVEPSYFRNIAGNPLTGPNGLTKEVLSDLMFGNLKSLASVGGLTTANSPAEDNGLSPQMTGNSELSGFNSPLLEEKLAKSQSGKSGLGLPLPPNESMDFNDLPNSDLDNINKTPYLQSRHHAKSKRKKKDNKSDVVTKLLLSLLVDKLKDIYEIDKMNSSQRKTLKLDSSTVGKIENTLKEHGHPSDHNKLTSGKDVNKEAKTSENFETNLSFPLTFSDTKGTQLSLVDSPKNDKDDSSLLDVDTKNIENIIKGIENGGEKSNETESIRIDSGNSPQEISQKTTKTLSPDINHLQTGSTSEFHRVKMEPIGELGKTANIPSISDYHPTLEVSEANPPSEQMFEVHTDKATISTLPTFSISSLLNQEIPGTVKGSNRVLNVVKENESGSLTGSNSATVPVTTTETEEHKGITTSASENDAANYLEASRVLGAVFNKVKDPLARKSVEVAIKAMLKLMKSENSYSKKESVPSSKSSSILQEKVKKLMKTIHELSKMVHVEDDSSHGKHKKYSRVKHKLFHKRFSKKRTIHHRTRVGMHHLQRKQQWNN